MFEIVNSPIWHGGDRGTVYPELDVQEPWSEAFFTETLDEFRPELVHIQEFAGLPTSLLDIVHTRQLPHVVVMHDYHPLCPTLKLWDSTGAICRRVEIGEACRLCCTGAPGDGREIEQITADYRREQMKRRLPRALVTAIQKMKRGGGSPAAVMENERAASVPDADLYQNRRDVNLRRFSAVDVMAPVSAREGELYRHLGVSAPIVPVKPGLLHIEKMQPQRFEAVPERLRFATINGAASVQKGSRILTGAMRILSERNLLERFELVLLGSTDAQARAELSRYDNVAFRPPFQHSALPAELAGVHVGIVPSVWEEIYGLVVDEFMTLGIPVIGAPVGAIPERIAEGRTGWTMADVSAEALADRMQQLMDRPQDILAVNRHLCDNFRPRTIREYADELDDLYRRLLSRRPGKRLPAGSAD